MRIVTFLAVTFLLSSSVFAVRKGSNFAGAIKDSVYTDSECGFSVKLPAGWKYSRGKVGELCHLHLHEDNKTQKELNKEFGTNIQGNLLEFWLVDSVPNGKALLDSILFDSSKSYLRKEFLKNLHINLDSKSSRGIENFRRKDTTISGKPATDWQGFRKLDVRMGSFESSFRSVLRLISIECGDHILLCLIRYIESDFWIKQAVEDLLSSLTFVEPNPAAEN